MSECDGDMYSVDIQLDNSDAKLRWNVKGIKKNGKFKKIIANGSVSGANNYKSRTMCLPKDACYRVTMKNLGGDWLSRGHGTRFYRIKKNGKSVECMFRT